MALGAQLPATPSRPQRNKHETQCAYSLIAAPCMRTQEYKQQVEVMEWLMFQIEWGGSNAGA